MNRQGITILDMEQEFEKLNHSINQNQTALHTILSSMLSEIKTIANSKKDHILKLKEKEEEVKQQIEELQHDIGNIHGNKTRAKQELLEIKEELERTRVTLQAKMNEKEVLNEKLLEKEKQLADKNVQLQQVEQKNQIMIKHGEMGMALYRSHLGLDIIRTSKGNLVFTFTQIRRSSPEDPFLLEISLDDAGYRLITSEPLLPNLKQIEDRLNATNNLAGCIAYVRKAFQNIAK